MMLSYELKDFRLSFFQKNTIVWYVKPDEKSHGESLYP